MKTGLLRYDRMVEGALRGVVRDVLREVAENGLPGDHHFYITFLTDFPGVEVPDSLRARYPDELTIVLQHKFWGLDVTEEAFEVTLSFNRVNERLHVPLAAITSFADPSVKFGLQFQLDEEDTSDLFPEDEEGLDDANDDFIDEPGAPLPGPTGAKDSDGARAARSASKDEERPTGEVIALDAFRKK